MNPIEYYDQKVKEALDGPGEGGGEFRLTGHRRRQLLKYLIMSYPKGSFIPLKEMSVVLHYEGNSSISGMLRRMLNDGDLRRQMIKGKPYYTVLIPPIPPEEDQTGYALSNKQPRQAKPLTAKATETPAEIPRTLPVEAGVHSEGVLLDDLMEDDPERTWTFKQLETEAMKYKFYYPEGGIPDFLNWL